MEKKSDGDGRSQLSRREGELESDREWQEMSQSQEKEANIFVAVRIRPFSESESRENGSGVIVKCVDERVVVFDPSDSRSVNPARTFQGTRRGKDIMFSFDRVFDSFSSQYEVFERTTKPLVASVLDGYNCCCFAYGATGAGKTYTMVGSAESPGVMVLTLHEIFSAMKASEKLYDISLSYLEIYNETIRDLLVSESRPLSLRESSDASIAVVGLSKYKPSSAEEVMELLEQGNARRTQCFTHANSQSSRSHAVLQITIRRENAISGVNAEVRVGKFSLVDLAGSERACKTKNQGRQLLEGANINRSLLALGNCINALGERYREGGYVPYRDSKLTRLLKDSLSGNCKTVMISNVSASSLCYEDTFNTLQYANRAKNIKTKIRTNELNTVLHVSQYRDTINRLTERNAELERELESCRRSLSALRADSARRDAAELASGGEELTEYGPPPCRSAVVGLECRESAFGVESKVDGLLQELFQMNRTLASLEEQDLSEGRSYGEKLDLIEQYQFDSDNRSSAIQRLKSDTKFLLRRILDRGRVIDALASRLTRASEVASRARLQLPSVSSEALRASIAQKLELHASRLLAFGYRLQCFKLRRCSERYIHAHRVSKRLFEAYRAASPAAASLRAAVPEAKKSSAKSVVPICESWQRVDKDLSLLDFALPPANSANSANSGGASAACRVSFARRADAANAAHPRPPQTARPTASAAKKSPPSFLRPRAPLAHSSNNTPRESLLALKKRFQDQKSHRSELKRRKHQHHEASAPQMPPPLCSNAVVS
ncbi:kinesin-like protein KIF18B [Schistocerca gregaria]|uniref:kinesin-like protein KIF18B n=1 Tax=Schistocerca gregaria TaxID=7010 RepID=UPI00211E91C2|nr:kinesin-like protein KIF18B [Schistocerca gregaria]